MAEAREEAEDRKAIPGGDTSILNHSVMSIASTSAKKKKEVIMGEIHPLSQDM